MRAAGPLLAVSDAYKLAPWADALYSCDPEWWDEHAAKVTAAGFTGQRWTQSQSAALKYGLRWISALRRDGLSRDPRVIHTGGNSGYQAVNLAYLFGARRILLLGFDMKPSAGREHFFGSHPGQLRRSLPFNVWIQDFRTLAADLKAEGVEVINCTPGSALDCFPKAQIEDVI